MRNSQQTRVLYIITKSVWGGAQRYVFDLATNLPKDTFEVAVALGGNGPLAEKLKAAGVEVYEIKNFQYALNPLRDISACFEIWNLIRRLRPAIVHANSSKAGGIAAFAATFAGIPRPRIVFTVHGWAYHESIAAWKLFVRRRISKLTAIFSDQLITVSEYDRQSAIKYGIAPEHKLITITPGISPTVDFYTRETAQEKLLGKHVPLLIGTIAEWTRNKSMDVFVESLPTVLKNFPQARFVFIGWGRDEEMLRKKINLLGLDMCVVMKSDITDAARYLHAFDVFVLPSRKEGLPYTLLEAGLASVPVIATSVGGIPEIIEQGKNGILVKPDSADELADAIIKLCKDVNLRKAMGDENRRRIEKNFFLEAMLKKTMGVYHSHHPPVT